MYLLTQGSILAEEEDEDEVTETLVGAKESNIKIPPIFVHMAGNEYLTLIQHLNSASINDFLTKQNGEYTKVIFNEINDFRKFRKYCEESNIEFHTYRDPSSKVLSVVIKDIPICYTEQDIIQELKRLEYPVTKVCRLYDKARNPIQIVAVDLVDNPKSKNIFNEDKLMYNIIRVQLRNKPNQPIQCKRCQRFGHTQANCHNVPRCVKCLENHHYSQCQKHEGVAPKCVNCKGDHTANYRGCPEFKKFAKPYQGQFRRPLTNLQTNRFIQFSAPRQPSATSSPPSSSTSIRQPPPPPPSLHSTNFPPLRLPYNRAWNNNQYNNIPDINNLISNIVSQIISILMPQIQNMILNVLPSYYNGPK